MGGGGAEIKARRRGMNYSGGLEGTIFGMKGKGQCRDHPSIPPTLEPICHEFKDPAHGT